MKTLIAGLTLVFALTPTEVAAKRHPAYKSHNYHQVKQHYRAPVPPRMYVASPVAPKQVVSKLTYSERVHYAFHFFRTLGWSKHHAAAIVGNLIEECGPGLVYETCNGDGGTAFGVAQWRFDRVTRFQQVIGKPLRNANLAEQLYYVHWELTAPESFYKVTAGDVIKRATDASHAAALVDAHYERSAGHTRHRRMAHANALYHEYRDWVSAAWIHDPSTP